MTRTNQEQVVHFLSDMYSVEQQALVQLVSAPDIAGDPEIAADFRDHYAETQEQADLVRARLEALGGSPSKIKDAVMKLGGKGFLLFAQAQPETPGRLIDHAYSYEAMEWAGYEMLKYFAEQAGDAETIAVAKAVGLQERAMMERLARRFDLAEAASHVDMSPEKLQEHVAKHLAEVHAFESQSDKLLKKSADIAGTAALETVYNQLLQECNEHARLVEQRLKALDTSTSNLKDSALSMGGLNWGLFFQAQSDSPAKLAAFVYAVLNLEIGGYELLMRTARRAGDAETERLCETILAAKSNSASKLAELFETAAQATLEMVHA